MLRIASIAPEERWKIGLTHVQVKIHALHVVWHLPAERVFLIGDAGISIPRIEIVGMVFFIYYE